VKVQKRGKRGETMSVQTAQIINAMSYCIISGLTTAEVSLILHVPTPQKSFVCVPEAVRPLTY